VWRFQFDAANRLTNTITPLSRSSSQAYNNRGLLVSSKEPSGQTQTFNYDAKGRLINRTDSVGTTLNKYDANDNPTNVTENGMTNAWTYDAYDRVASYKDVYGNLIQYKYDLNGNMTNMVYPGGKNVYYAYDSLNHMTNVTDWSARRTRITYDLAARLTGITRPNGTERTIGYDAVGQTTSILEKLMNGGSINLFKLSWDNAARMATEYGAPLPHSATVPMRNMSFDDDNRLTGVDGNTVNNDADGNMTNGPLTSDTPFTYTYDARNRLLNAGGVTNAYDPAGNRVGITYGTNSVAYVINPNTKLSQVLMRVKNGVTNYYIYGPGLLYQITESATVTNTLTYHYDFRGSTVALTDGTGTNVTDRIEYSAYATITYRTGTNDTPFLFNGRYGVMIDHNGLLYMRARYYNPYLCRFLNPDPIGFSGGLNFYAYADGNPVSYLDPFGLSAWTSAGGVLRTVGGGLETAAGYGLATAGAGISTTGIGALIGVPAAALGVAIGAHGLDQVQAGARQTVSGNYVDSFTSGDLQMAGMSQNAANLTDAGISVVGSFGAGFGTTAIRVTQLSATSISSEVANASLLTKMGYYEAGQLSLPENAYGYYSMWGNTIDRGAAMVADQGWMSALSQGSLTLGLREGTLFTTGLPTPLGSGLGGAAGGVVNWLGQPVSSSPNGK
jgi:RHS repeat-associated protein